ncbi:sulfite exporter TauE/SafE family protein [Ferviditalea candida]|uniref:Probable membrane transporter protein n=1 Tax=Ferviditalea candida TaxID=3108399 RepID=A0ABU5ZK31_9BACL|nr:sulfite exporter TauE/SafE family protein [Paenibacillaceae bacterium T2]
MEFSWTQIIIGLISALLVGFGKTGVPAVSIFNVMLMASIFPAKQSVGILLPMLIVGDIVAVTYYRRQVIWKHLISLIPWVLAGIVIGYFVLLKVHNEQLKVMIGILVLLLVALHFIRERWGEKINRFMLSRKFNASMGVLAGFATMIGNAAGGVMAIYLLSKKLPKHQFVATGAWFFLTVNLIKIPFNISLGLLNWQILQYAALMIPVILVGTWIGIKLLPKIPQKHFQSLILVLSVIGAIDLML